MHRHRRQGVTLLFPIVFSRRWDAIAIIAAPDQPPQLNVLAQYIKDYEADGFLINSVIGHIEPVRAQLSSEST